MKCTIVLILLGAAMIVEGLSLDSNLELHELLDTLEHDLNVREERRLALQDADNEEERGLEALEVREGSEEPEGIPEERILLEKAKPKPILPLHKPCEHKCCIQGQKVVKLNQLSNPGSGFLPGLTVLQKPTPRKGSGQCSNTALIKVNFERISDEPCDSCLTDPHCGRRMLRIDLHLAYGPRNGFLFNIGDSVSNDGYKGDYNDQQNDAETEGKFPHINVYTSDKCPKSRFLANIENAIGPNVNHVTIYVSNGFIRVTNDAGLDREVCGEKCLYALNGQTDTGPKGGINEDIYIALNRVVSGRNDRYGVGVCSATFRWTCP